MKEPLNEFLNEKIRIIKELIRGKNVLVAFSGGVDSSVVLKLAQEFSNCVTAITASSQTVSKSEIDAAKELADKIGVDKHLILQYDELLEDGFKLNPSNRCYICKMGLFSKMLEIGIKNNSDLILEGTNSSDLSGHRPGYDALQELKVLSPLVEAKISKEEVREIARYYNLSVANKPSMACFASRIPYGSPITNKKIQRVSQAENSIRALAVFDTLRIRDHDEIARIEVGIKEFAKFFDKEIQNKIIKLIKKAGYRYVVFDLEGYRPVTPFE